VPRLVTGAFDPATQKAVWPSTGNYCRGGAYDCALLSCPAVAILPEGMSRERFEWLREIGTDEIIATPGTESNVKEIYDMCWQLREERGDGIVIFNQALPHDRLGYRRDLQQAFCRRASPVRLRERNRFRGHDRRR
jgi:cysteine synthase